MPCPAVGRVINLMFWSVSPSASVNLLVKSVAMKVSVVSSFVVPVSVLTTGAVPFFLIVKVFEFTGHPPVSVILISTLVVPPLGVNPNERFVPFAVRLDHQFVE